MIRIRRAVPEDASAIVEFQLLMARETEDKELDRDLVTQGVSSVFGNNGRGIYYVATVNDKPIASLLITYEWSDWRNGNIHWIQSVYVIPEYRNQGVFKSMYKAITEEIQDDDSVKGIRLYVHNTNSRAQGVYESIGMNGGSYKVFEWMKP